MVYSPYSEVIMGKLLFWVTTLLLFFFVVEATLPLRQLYDNYETQLGVHIQFF